MDFLEVIQACRRRWYVVVPLFLITAVTSVVLYVSVKPVYYSNAVLTIVPPSTPSAVNNGLLQIGGSGVLANMAVIAFQDPSVKSAVRADGGNDDFVVRMFPIDFTNANAANQLPLIMIEATEPSPELAKKTAQLAAAQTDRVLRDLQQQAAVPSEAMVKALLITSPEPLRGLPSRKKSTVTIFIVGLCLSVLAGVGADFFAARRRLRRGESQATATEGESHGAGDRSEIEPQTT